MRLYKKLFWPLNEGTAKYYYFGTRRGDKPLVSKDCYNDFLKKKEKQYQSVNEKQSKKLSVSNSGPLEGKTEKLHIFNVYLSRGRD